MAEGLGKLPRCTRGVQKSVVVTKHTSGDFVDKHYEMVQMIGQGSFGKVSLVRDLKTGQERVCKVVSTEGMQPHLLEMMRKEVEMLCTLDHPHIVKIFEYAMDDQRGELVLILEHLAGGDCLKMLRDTLMSQNLLSEGLVARLMHQVFLALCYCHTQGVLHRDIKPDNMMLTGEDLLGVADCKVIDFGVATRHDSLERGVWGTLSHIAPEVAAQTGDIYSPKADVWSAGVTTLQLLTGVLPFGRPTISAGCRQGLHLIANYKNFDEDVGFKVQDVPGWEDRSPEAQSFVRWLLTADPSQRPSCAEVLEHPWLQMHKAETESLTQEMVQSLSSYPLAPPLVRCCLYAIAARQSVPDLERFGTSFLRLDREGNGKLSRSDLEAALGESVNVDSILSAADLDHTGGLSFTEFVAACLYKRYVHGVSLEDLLRSAFEALDADRDGLVQVAEIRGLFRERDAPFLERLPQDSPFDLKVWCDCLQNSQPVAERSAATSAVPLRIAASGTRTPCHAQPGHATPGFAAGYGAQPLQRLAQPPPVAQAPPPVRTSLQQQQPSRSSLRQQPSRVVQDRGTGGSPPPVAQAPPPLRSALRQQPSRSSLRQDLEFRSMVDDVFHKNDVNSDGMLEWNNEEILRFSRELFRRSNIDVPDWPQSVWYRLYRDIDVDDSYSVNKEEAIQFAYACFEKAEQDKQPTPIPSQITPTPLGHQAMMISQAGRAGVVTCRRPSAVVQR